LQPSKTDLARAAFDAFNKRDLEAALKVMDPAVEFHAPTSELANQGHAYLGHEGMTKYYEDVGQVWQQLDVMPAEFREVGDHVLAFGRVYGRGPGGYIQDSPAQWVFTVRGDLIVCVKVFTNRTAALAEVGLAE
jgi:ketosteroid isomerase-like protein